MKEGDVVMIYANPRMRTQPVGEAKLVNLIRDNPKMQFWHVEFLDGYYGEVFIKKEKV